MDCNDGSRDRDYDGEKEARKMRNTVGEMKLSDFTVTEFKLVQKLFDNLDFHKWDEGMEKMRNLIKQHAKKEK